MKRLLKLIVFAGALAGAAWALRDQLMPPPQRPSATPPAFRTPEPDMATAGADDGEDDLELVNGIGPVRVGQLAEEGITTFEDLVDSDTVDLAAKLGVSVSQVEDWVDQAKRHI